MWTGFRIYLLHVSGRFRGGAEPAPPTSSLGRRADAVTVLLISDNGILYYGDAVASYKQVTYSDASIIISLPIRLAKTT